MWHWIKNFWNWISFLCLGNFDYWYKLYIEFLLRFFFFAKYFEAAERLSPASINSSSSFLRIDLLKFPLLILSWPLITIVISPIISRSLKESITLSIWLFTCSSNFFVNSRDTLISLCPPQYFFNSISSWFIR